VTVLKVAAWNDPRYGFARDAERLGVESLWSPEAWAFDAFTPLAYVAGQTETIRLGTAIAQLGARTPAMLAMTALSMQVLTHDPFDKPIARTRQTIETIRAISSGEKVGKIRSPLAPKHVPIYVASLGPANLRLTGELADGWIGNSFVPEHAEVFFAPMREANRFDELDITVAVGVEITEDEDVFARHARGYAFTFGAMGSREHNFYVDAFARQGYEDDVRAVQQLWLDGKREEAAARVPREIGEKTNLLGTPEMIKARLRLYRDCGVRTLRVGLPQERDLDTLAQLLDLVREVNEEPSVR
jgi:alkanesulfonate monooxygenase SsuD/methylene tetrahydromethanopterin reductase-like flavin-dependent oxidoreductase (luciferase family)